MFKFCFKLLPIFILMVQSCATKPSEKNDEPNKKSFEIFTLDNPPEIGTWDEVVFYEGGFSGLYYIAGSDNEFYLVNDRGPNMVIEDTLNKNAHIKFFPFPEYAQKLVRVKLENNKIIVLRIDTLKAPTKNVSGLPLPTFLEKDQAEIAWRTMEGDIIPNDVWGIDAEGIVFENDTLFWLADEYRPSLWQFNSKNNTVVSILSPSQSYNSKFKLPSEYLYRGANMGFESVAITPAGKLVTVLQSPITNYSKDVSHETRLSRFLLFDYKTGESETYVYEMNDTINNKKIKWKIGDMAAIDDTRFLVLEHAKIQGKLFAGVYLIDVSEATSLDEKNNFKIEEFRSASDLYQSKGILSVNKKLILNLTENGYDSSIEKPEGLAIINDSTIAIVNDNDFAIEAKGSKNLNHKTNIYLFKLEKQLSKTEK
jgi:uncharacterized protein YjiK